LAIALSFTTAVAERREKFLLALRGAERSDLRKKTVNNSDELMVLQERIELSTSPYQGDKPRRIARLGPPRARPDFARGVEIGGKSGLRSIL
jgi:hypothetical protein